MKKFKIYREVILRKFQKIKIKIIIIDKNQK